MKYPKTQFELLKKTLKVMSNHFEIKKTHPGQLQYIAYQQASKEQGHNAFFINKEGDIKRGFYVSALSLPGYTKLVDFLNEENFPLYPEGCNDSHIETAVKRAIKEL